MTAPPSSGSRGSPVVGPPVEGSGPPRTRSLADLVAPLPPVRPVDVAGLADAVTRGRRLVVLDDDPTGTQCVVDLPVLLTWSVEDLRWALRQDTRGCFVLTNSRSLSAEAAAHRNREVVRALHAAAAAEGIEFVIASRSDSTLRGHYPLETDVLTEELRRTGRGVDAILVVPAYLEAGRLTIEAVHWTPGEGGMIPVADSESARDATFGFTQSDLRRWIEEKTGGRIAAGDVARIDVEDLRRGGPDAVAAILMACTDARPVVVDAAAEEDLHVLAAAVLQAEARGRQFVYRTGPSFVRARVGQTARPPLDGERLGTIVAHRGAGDDRTPSTRGLIVVGSHVGRTTRQLDALRRRGVVEEIEVDVAELLDPLRREEHLAGVIARVGSAMPTPGADVVVRTSRALVRGADPAASLDIARTVSAALVAVVRAVVARHRPAFVIAKGGITSADVATSGLAMHRAWARGTLLPGIISVWEPVSGSAVGVPYVVFAGNVGDDDALATIVGDLHRLLPDGRTDGGTHGDRRGRHDEEEGL